MSGASNLGYSRIMPINTNYVNATSSNNPSFFGNTYTPTGNHGLFGAKSNIDAADGKVPGICLFKGGSRNLKRKIKNISKKYKKMKRGSKKMRSLKRKLKTKFSRLPSKGRKTMRHKKQRGGYSQYQNNMPVNAGYSTGGNLSPSMSALANPVPFKAIGGNCVDNYSRYTNMGFSSKGH